MVVTGAWEVIGEDDVDNEQQGGGRVTGGFIP